MPFRAVFPPEHQIRLDHVIDRKGNVSLARDLDSDLIAIQSLKHALDALAMIAHRIACLNRHLFTPEPGPVFTLDQRPLDARRGNLEHVPLAQIFPLVEVFFDGSADRGAFVDRDSLARLRWICAGPFDPNPQQRTGLGAGLFDVYQLKSQSGNDFLEFALKLRPLHSASLPTNKQKVGVLRPHFRESAVLADTFTEQYKRNGWYLEAPKDRATIVARRYPFYLRQCKTITTGDCMRRFHLAGFLFMLAAATPASAQTAQVPAEQLAVYAKAYGEIGKLRDQMQAELAELKNKKDEAQLQLHARMREEVARILSTHGLTEAGYNRITFAISADPETRRAFDKLMGIAPPAPPPSAPAMPANPHVGHVTTSFNGTPGTQGLLPVAMAEARVVVQHAGLLAQSTGNLDAMKQHATHVLHALDPVADSRGPGAGYGLKKAVAGLLTHIELAAKADGAPATVTTHSAHIATSARNTAARTDQLIALIKQIQSTSSPADAAKFAAQLQALASQLIAGADANGDGRITWEAGEGGLQQVEQHVGLMTQVR